MAENKQTRLTRELETREFDERPKQWMPPELLPEPDNRLVSLIAGFAFLR